MREYKIIHLGEWDSQDIRGTEEKVKVETLLNMKQSEQKYGFNKRIKNVDNFLDLKDVEIQFSDLSKDGWISNARHQGTVLYLNRTGNNGQILAFNRSGATKGEIAVTTTSAQYYTTSDARLKENIIDAPSASDDIDAIQVRSFDWKEDDSHQKYGMIAQELLPVAPDAVSQPEDSEEMMSIDYSKLVPMLVKEIQSLRTRVTQLEEEK